MFTASTGRRPRPEGGRDGRRRPGRGGHGARGGIGKTQLANEFVHRYGQYFQGGVFWLSFADLQNVPAEVAACGGPGAALDLQPGFGNLPLDDQVRLVAVAWRDWLPRPLVFDNCEDRALLSAWCPPTGGCRVLVTNPPAAR